MDYIQRSSEPEFQSDVIWESMDATPEPNSDAYAQSYSNLQIHEEMIKDSTRTNAYRNAIIGNAELFSGRTVLDVGCGTGILSVFAVRAGAAHVYAVDFADIINHAREIVRENGYENRITCIQGRVEDI
jgi:protein arginine N-methyltransferase 1